MVADSWAVLPRNSEEPKPETAAQVVLKTRCVEGVITKMKQITVSKGFKSINTTDHFISGVRFNQNFLQNLLEQGGGRQTEGAVLVEKSNV